MIELDATRFPPEICNLLMLRGAVVPPLVWTERVIPAGRALLDGLAEDEQLMGGLPVANEEMVAALRAALYLWNGCAAECEMYAQGAPVAERLYITGILRRQQGPSEKAKLVFRELGEHRIHPELTAYALKTISSKAHPSLTRIRGIFEMDGRWEAFAYIDLFEQVRAGKLSGEDAEIVRKVQSREFELLLVHCFEVGTGAPLASIEPVAQPNPRPRRRPATRVSPQRHAPAPVSVGMQSPSRKSDPAMKVDRVGILCPKCQTLAVLPASARGKKHQCKKCSAIFLVPAKVASRSPS